MEFRKINLISGWGVWLISTIVYLLTIEPTASFWDCGEFIATAYKLEVGHPPGAPFFMILGRFFSMFAPLEYVPTMLNVLSALASSFTILFLFWTITHMARKIAWRSGELTDGKIIAVIGSGIVGAFAYAFSDSFWFSAVEGEVYALSSFFTAIVFWAILRWESVADEAHDKRWLILIAYLMGLSIGVHLLNLLAIPAMAFVYYFRKYEPTRKGLILTFIIGAAILVVIQGFIIPGVVSLAGKFELIFVNGMGMPFNTGLVIYGLLLVGLIVWGLKWSQATGRSILNTAILGFTVILLGYSTYFLIVIRSSANPPMDENNPENVFTLLSYLNREQYGDRPLFYGQYWDSPRIDAKDGAQTYVKAWLVEENGRMIHSYNNKWAAEQFLQKNSDKGYNLNPEYLETDEKKSSVYVYDSRFTMFFPRMYSSQAHHVREYKSWINFKGKAVQYDNPQTGEREIKKKPTFGENIKYFTDYQLGWMYFRYFMWNFSGRQNDVQGHGNIMDGNWLSGIKAIDAERLGNQDELPNSMLENKGYNRMFYIPLILGLMGMFFQLFRNNKDWSVVLLLFFFTGIAIAIYLNQYPRQPRERDYAYVGSFYAFAIWIGLSVYALFDAAKNIEKKQLMYIAGSAFGIAVLKYLIEAVTSDNHAFSYSLFFIAIIGVGAMALMFLLGQVLKERKMHAILATLLAMVAPALMVADGWDDHDRGERYTARDFARNYLDSCEPNAIIFTNGDNDTFPLWYAQEVEGIRTDIRVINLSLLNTDWYINQMRRKAYDSEPVPFSIPEEKYRQGSRDVVAMFQDPDKQPVFVELKRAIDFVSDDKNLRDLSGRGKRKDAYIPSKTFKITIDKEQVYKTGTLDRADSANIVDEIRWRIKDSYLLKNNLMLLDLLANNNWERPIYFAVTTGPDSYINLQSYFQLEGLAYRFIPVKTVSPPKVTPAHFGRVDTDKMYTNIMEKFKYGGMDSENEIYMDENNLRMTTNMRLQFSNLAEALVGENDNERAMNVLNKSLVVMPHHNVPFNRVLHPTVEAFYAAGGIEEGNELTAQLFNILENELDYFFSLDPEFAKGIDRDMRSNYAIINRLSELAIQNGATIEGGDVQERMKAINDAYSLKAQEIDAYGRQMSKSPRF